MKRLWPLIVTLLVGVASYLPFAILNCPTGMDILWFFLLGIAGIIFVIPLFVIIHETGHMVFGLATGYRLISFKVGPFEVYRTKENSLKLRVNSLAFMVLGQCLMEPPYNKKIKKVPFVLYDLGGLIFSYIQVLIIIGLCFVPNKYFDYFMYFQVLIGVMLVVNNSLYVPNGYNDVSNLILVLKYPKYKEAVLYQLEVVSKMTLGKRNGAKTFYNGYYEDLLNHISLPVVQFKLYNALDHDDIEQAKKYSEMISANLNNAGVGLQKMALTFEIIYVSLITDNMPRARRYLNSLNPYKNFIMRKKDTDVYCYYMMYNKIVNGNYDLDEEINLLLDPRFTHDGELLSLEKRLNILKNKYCNIKEDKNEENN